MNIHEYQAKELLRSYGIPVPKGEVVYSDKAAARVAEDIGGQAWVVKAQVHAGGRGKAGGVKIATTIPQLREITDRMIGQRLVTFQTGPEGALVQRVLVERACRIEKELYLGMVVDRQSQRVTVIASADGGVDVEEVARETPERIHKEVVTPRRGSSTSSAASSRPRSDSAGGSPPWSRSCARSTSASPTRMRFSRRSTRSS